MSIRARIQNSAFIAEATLAVNLFMPGARVMSFGHMGDGNMHFNVSQPPGMDKKKYLDGWNEMNKVVFDVVLRFGGSLAQNTYRAPEETPHAGDQISGRIADDA